MNKQQFALFLQAVLMTSFVSLSMASLAEDSAAPSKETSDKEISSEADKVKSKPDDDQVNPLDHVDINIIKRKDRVIETHSVNGIVYKVKVIPKNAPVYYLYDTDGDGSLETRTNREISETTVQQWKIFQW